MDKSPTKGIFACDKSITIIDSSFSEISQTDQIEILDEITFAKSTAPKLSASGPVGIQKSESPDPQKVPNRTDVSQEEDDLPLPSLLQGHQSDSIHENDSSSSLEGIVERLCCRSYFIKGQKLFGESKNTEFKQYKMTALTPAIEYTLTKVICAFLNSNGGNVFIGVHETQTFDRFIIGANYSETDKENIFRKLRELAQTIKPDIIACQLFDVGFMPVVRVENGTIIPFKGRYVIKISVEQGNPQKLYTVLSPFSGLHEVCFRTQNEVLTYKQMCQGFQFLEERLKYGKRLVKHFPHENPCSLQGQKLQFGQILKKQKANQKKAFKTNTRLESGENFEDQISYLLKSKKFFTYFPNLLPKVTQSPPEKDKISHEKVFLPVPQDEFKPIAPQLEQIKKETLKACISSSPFLFKQQVEDDEETEHINY